jgi:hypothetical protein
MADYRPGERLIDINHPKNRSLPERFASKYKRTDTCWLWRTSTLKYPTIRVWANDSWVNESAHRVAMALQGSLQHGHVLHRCDVKACVNPEHLYISDHAQNMRDAKERQRMRAGNRTADAKIKQIVDLRSQNFTMTAIAQELGVGIGTVHRWCARG